MRRSLILNALVAIGLGSLVSACATTTPPTVPPVANVELPRFMGDWYVIAHIPSRFERRAHNAIESYSLAPDGRVLTTFQYRNDGFDSPLKTMRPVGYVRPGSGDAVWDMQFIWPIRAEYVISYVDSDYTQTIIGRSKHDYAWVMARTPVISDAEYGRLEQRLRDLGYSLEGLRRVPQRWPEAGADRRSNPK